MRGLLVVDRGEFGWSLCSLAPRARAVAVGFDDVVVVTPRDRCSLFDDFATTLVPAVPEPGTQDFLEGGLLEPTESAIAGLSVGRLVWPTPAEARQVVRLERASFADAAVARLESGRKAWRRFGAEGAERGALVCVAFRPPKLHGGKVHAWKAWPQERCEELVAELVDRGLRVLAVGGPDNLAPRGSEDLRGRPLLEQAAWLSKAAVCAGPSSGPLHFAHACGCPVVTWYDAPDSTRASSESRYRLAWNPFGAGLAYLQKRCPSPPDVVAALWPFVSPFIGRRGP